MGEVGQPTTLTIDRAGMSITEALSKASGLNQTTANATGVFVIRPIKNQPAADKELEALLPKNGRGLSVRFIRCHITCDGH